MEVHNHQVGLMVIVCGCPDLSTRSSSMASQPLLERLAGHAGKLKQIQESFPEANNPSFKSGHPKASLAGAVATKIQRVDVLLQVQDDVKVCTGKGSGNTCNKTSSLKGDARPLLVVAT